MSESAFDRDEQLFVIGPRAGVHPQLETLASMLQNARRYLLSASRDLTSEQLTFLPSGVGNSIGALLSHIAAGEKMFQNLLFRGYQFGDDERDFESAFRFRGDPLAGQEVAAYHARLAEVRSETLQLFAGVDDAWLAEPLAFAGRPGNRHYYWLHFLMDEVRHTGQIILLRKHLLPGADGSYDAFALRR